jgi:hypothetical protein
MQEVQEMRAYGIIIGFDFKPKQVGAFSDTDGP